MRSSKKCFTKEFLESQNTEMIRQSELALLSENVSRFPDTALGVEWVLEKVVQFFMGYNCALYCRQTPMASMCCIRSEVEIHDSARGPN